MLEPRQQQLLIMLFSDECTRYLVHNNTTAAAFAWYVMTLRECACHRHNTHTRYILFVELMFLRPLSLLRERPTSNNQLQRNITASNNLIFFFFMHSSSSSVLAVSFLYIHVVMVYPDFQLHLSAYTTSFTATAAAAAVVVVVSL